MPAFSDNVGGKTHFLVLYSVYAELEVFSGVAHGYIYLKPQEQSEMKS